MLAEIHSKISRTGSNLSDRLEDKLTGDVFGAIRYLPFEVGLKNILRKVVIKGAGNLPAILEEVNGYDYQMDFWVRSDFGELDMLVRVGPADIAVEVKYLSGLSSDDEVDNSRQVEFEKSINQLARYADFLMQDSEREHKVLILLAPIDTGIPIIHNAVKRKLVREPVMLGFLSWQDVLSAFKDINMDELEVWQRMIVSDLIELLKRKGFDVFKSFTGGIELSISEAGYVYRQPAFRWQYEFNVEEGLYYDFKS